MNLFQYETFFAKHFDAEVKSRGTFLIGVINQLQAELLLHREWSNGPFIQSRSRMLDMKIRAVIHAIDRSGGDKSKAAKWLGLSRANIYLILKKWDTIKPKFSHESKVPTSSIGAPSTNSVPVN